jgi:plasmid stabilization system protein ParE
MAYQVVIEPRALSDAQQAIDYYDEQQIGLGKKFNNALVNHIDVIKKNPFFKIHYKDYRILPVKKYPYIIIFYINENIQTAYILAIFNTSQNPDKQPK